jgi:fermentation-respiration switch protein FrsA (DUF1100 family)
MNLPVIILLSAIALTAALIGTSFFLYHLAIARTRTKPDIGNGEGIVMEDYSGFLSLEVTSWLDRQAISRVMITSEEGLHLNAYYIPSPKPSRMITILAHGYSGEALSNMSAIAKMYQEHFNCHLLMPDARGHGQSEGRYIGFGWHERKDVQRWIDWSIERIGLDSHVVLYGISMGGATMLMTSGEQLPEQVKCIIADCAYTSTRDILAYQLKQMYKLPAFPFINLTSLVCRLRAGYSFHEASALKQVGQTQKPILFIHGQDDTFVPTEMVDRLYDSCHADKEKWIVPRAGHALSYFADQKAYVERVEQFIRKYITEELDTHLGVPN